MIKFNDVSCKYKDETENSISNISFHIKEGECILLTGASGSGKSTIVKIINALIPNLYEAELSGDIYLDGQNIKNKKSYEISKLIGTVNQDPRGQFFTGEVISELAFEMENYGYDSKKMLEIIKRDSKKMGITHLLDRSVYNLSSGERQRLSVACSLTVSPKILIFDEPSSNLDYATTMALKKIIQELKNSGHTIIIAEHRLFYLLEICDRLFYMKAGKLETIIDKKDFDTKLSYEDLRSAKPFELGFKGVYDDKIYGRAPLLKLKNLSYMDILKNINLELRKGEVLGVIGKNGAGKTTLAKSVVGLLKNVAGKIEKEKAMFVMQDIDYQLFTESVKSELKLGTKNIRSEDIENTLKEVGLWELKNKQPLSLSGGQKQRVVIAVAVVSKFDILIFDEPTSGLDAKNMKRVSTLINNMKDDRGIIIITHDFELISEVCNRIVMMENGKISREFILEEDKRSELISIFSIS